MGIPHQVWPALWLIAEDLVWGPEWDMWEYFGHRSEVDPPYDNMGAHLCFGEWPKQKWRSHWLNQFDMKNDIEAATIRYNKKSEQQTPKERGNDQEVFVRKWITSRSDR